MGCGGVVGVKPVGTKSQLWPSLPLLKSHLYPKIHESEKKPCFLYDTLISFKAAHFMMELCTKAVLSLLKVCGGEEKDNPYKTFSKNNIRRHKRIACTHFETLFLLNSHFLGRTTSLGRTNPICAFK